SRCSRLHLLCASDGAARFSRSKRARLATVRPGATGRAHDGGDDRRPAMARILSAAGAQHICSGYGQPTAHSTAVHGRPGRQTMSPTDLITLLALLLISGTSSLGLTD